MNIKNLLAATSAFALGLATLAVPARAQGPLYDKVIVDLPYSVTIGNKVLQPGNYVIRQNESTGGGSRVLLIYSNQGMHFETSTMTIPTLDNLTPNNTKVVLHRFGSDYYFDKIWIQGKNYGYEFPLPESVKSRERERMQPVSVAARYEATPTPATQTTQTAEAQTRTESTETRAENQTQNQTQMAQATPPPAPREQVPAPSTAYREEQTAPAPRRMPHTSADWVMTLLSGGLLSGAGLTLRRRS